MPRTIVKYRSATRLADWAFSATFALECGLMLHAGRVGTAAPFLLVSAVNVLLFLVIEPDAEDAHRDPPLPPRA